MEFCCYGSCLKRKTTQIVRLAVSSAAPTSAAVKSKPFLALLSDCLSLHDVNG